MYFHMGQRPFGKCDVVPELFYVATWFFHVDFIPLVPMGTRLVLGQTGKSYRVVRIPFSARSLAYAWLRALLVAGMIGFTVLALMSLNDPQMRRDWGVELPAILAAFCGIIFAWIMIYPRRRMPSYERACALAQHAKLDEREWAALNVLYGRDPFERPVADSAATSAKW